ncbi:pol protein [Cucumis melo var. makuwa]|uniref:Pol protein n=1 Tax=Cucumis melo var. makuwa TaxID=1194695 RepID=A0A5D3DJ56_CUCMM|nr:pol protein [Cucumis melo var. makuwa]
MLGFELVQTTNAAIEKIRARMLIAHSKQKSYADERHKDLEFYARDMVFLKVAPMKDVLRFEKKGNRRPQPRRAAAFPAGFKPKRSGASRNLKPKPHLQAVANPPKPSRPPKSNHPRHPSRPAVEPFVAACRCVKLRPAVSPSSSGRRSRACLRREPHLHAPRAAPVCAASRADPQSSSRVGSYSSSRADPPALEPPVCSGSFPPTLYSFKERRGPINLERWISSARASTATSIVGKLPPDLRRLGKRVVTVRTCRANLQVSFGITTYLGLCGPTGRQSSMDIDMIRDIEDQIFIPTGAHVARVRERARDWVEAEVEAKASWRATRIITSAQYKELSCYRKLNPRFVRSFEILERIDPIAYCLVLPLSFSTIHDAFHVSMLRKYVADPTHIIDFGPLQINENLSYEEQPVEILAREVKMVHNRGTTLVKVLWRNHEVEEATWERGDDMRAQYPALFED